MPAAKKGDRVQVHYTGTFPDGEQFDTSRGAEPLEFVLGEGTLIPGFEKCLVGMSPGDTKTVTIPPEDAYGERSEASVATVERDRLPDDIAPELGMMLQLTTEDGQVAHAFIAEVTETEVTLDANHPLAGRELVFEISLEAIL
ncbi:MAG: peptidylprolyl isomerase [Desulfovibrionaceae bacterium]|jgi:peptidylprolyl isomerase|nr:peptidylprolyl isomerase [Desulfovibrionaceae bacterium]